MVMRLSGIYARNCERCRLVRIPVIKLHWLGESSINSFDSLTETCVESIKKRFVPAYTCNTCNEFVR